MFDLEIKATLNPWSLISQTLQVELRTLLCVNYCVANIIVGFKNLMFI